jgi:CBS domain-containing protein
MQARDIMTRPVITFRARTSVREAAAVLTGKQITAAPVLDDADEIIGMVSEGDLIADRFGHDPRSHARRDTESEHDAPATVGAVMTDTVIAMSVTADAADLAETMLRHDVRSIPIVEGSTVLGIVSRRDLLRTLIRDDDVIRAEVAHRLDTYTGGRQQWDVQVDQGRVRIDGPVEDEAEGQILLILARTVPGVAHADMHVRQPAGRR